jgi:hypothetical protein
MVVADASGVLSTQSLGSGAVTGSGTTNYLPKFTGASTIGNSIVSESGGIVSVAGRFSASGNDFHSLLVAEGSAQLKLERTSTSTGLMYLGADNVGFKVFDSAFATRLTLTSGGNLGLGVTPSAWFVVHKVMQLGGNFSGTAYAGAFTAQTNDNVINLFNNAFVNSSNVETYYASAEAAKYVIRRNAHEWYTAPSGTAGNAITFTQAMTLDANGRLGIGTTSPAVKLNVRGDEGQPGTTGTTQNGILRVHAGSTEGWGETLDMGMHVGISGPASYAWLQATNTSDLSIEYNLALNPNGGNVGIGTASPSHRLDVNGGAADTTLRVQTTGQNPVRFRLTNEERDFILTNNPGDDLLSFFYADANRLQFNTTNQWFNSGNVGIGTTSPSTKLEVNGTITETSSIRYKENIETIKYGLDKILQMRGVTYDRKDSGLKEVGVIAEEINEIFPDLVVKNEEGLVESVSYGRFTALLIEAIKELKIEIEELKANR